MPPTTTPAPAKPATTPVTEATKPLRAAIIKASIANTLAWAKSEGLEPQQFGPESARDQRLAQLTADLGRQISGGSAHLKALIEELHGRPLPSLESSVSKWAPLIGVVTEADGTGPLKGTVHVLATTRNGWRSVDPGGIQSANGPSSTKANIRPATPDEIKTAVALLSDAAILELSVDLTLTA